MKKITLLSRALGLLLLLLTAAPAFAQFKVVGYLPSWNGEVSGVQFPKLTHVNYAFLLPNGDGSLKPIENPAKLQSLVSTAHANNVKVIISVGGWLDGNPGVFISIANNAGYTSAFTTNLVNFVNQYNLDGVDIDWEHPDANTAGGYASVMQSLATQLHSRGKLLTTAVAGGTWAGGYIQNSVLSNVDFLNIMAYDDTPPNHSAYALASQSISYWRGRGLAASKTVLGVPFYGQPNGVPFATLLAQGADPQADLFNGVGYNGIATIKSKTNLAFDQGGGVMIWHLGQDAVGANSLLTAINQVVGARGTSPTPSPPASAGVATMYQDCNYSSTAVALPVGDYNLAALQAKGIYNDDISSLQVSSGYRVVLYADDNFGGAALTLASSNGCLANNALGAGNWNDKATSLRVQAVASSFSRQLEAESANTNSGMVVETCSDTGGGQNMGYIDANDYLVFTNVNFPTTGTYLIEYRVASGASGGTISADLNAGNVQLGSTAVPATGGWQAWRTVSRTVTINAGTYNFGVFARTGGYNLNWVRISKSTSARGALAPTPLQAGQGEVLTLYPNPATDQLTLSSALALTGSHYRILNATGQRVAGGSAASGTVRVAALPAGVYTLILTTQDQQTITRRFVK